MKKLISLLLIFSQVASADLISHRMIAPYTKADVGLGNVLNLDQSNPSNIVQSPSFRFSTDSEKSFWNGKQDFLGFTPVPNTLTINGHALNSNFSIAPSDLTLDSTHRFVTDAQITAWNAKQSSGSYELSTNKTSDTSSNDDSHYPSTKFVHDAIGAIPPGGVTAFNGRTGSVSPQSGDYDGSDINQDSTHRFVSDSEKSNWNSKQDAGDYAEKSYVDTAIAGATIADASSTVKGKLKLAGDLGGTADAPTVPALANKADSSSLGSAAYQNTTAFDASGSAASALSSAESYASNPSNVTQDSTHRFSTDTEKSFWNAKQSAFTLGDALTFTSSILNVKYDGTTIGLNGSNQLSLVSPPSIPTVNQHVYVSLSGNDGTGNGTFDKPYLTIQHALTSITDATISKTYEISIGQGIFYQSSDIKLKPFIFIRGADKHTTTVYFNTDHRFIMGSDFGTADSASYGIYSLTITTDFSVPVDLQPGAIFGVATTQSSQGYFKDIACNGTLNLYGRVNSNPSAVDGIYVENSLVSSLTVDSASLNSLRVEGGVDFSNSQSASGISIYISNANSYGVNIVGQGTELVSLSNITYWSDSTLNATGLSTLYLYNAKPYTSAHTNIAGIGVTYEQSSTGFEAATPYNWTGAAPTILQEAVERLVAKYPENAVVPTTPANPIFGNGADGSVTISSGTTTITRDMQYLSLTISGSGHLNTNGFQVRVKQVLDLSNAPANAIQYTSSGGGPGGGSSGGAGGTAKTGVNAGGFLSGGAGQTGGTGAGAQGVASSTLTVGNGGTTEKSGKGGAASLAGGIAGIATSITNAQSITSPERYLFRGLTLVSGGASGAGGSSGAGDGVNTGGGGGGGGTGAGVVAIAAKTINRGASTTAEAINVKGGQGGNGGSVLGNAGGGGGGAGGGGGWIYLIYSELTGSTATNMLCADGGAGGVGGTGAGTGKGGDGGYGGGSGRITLINTTTGVATEYLPSAPQNPTNAGGTTSTTTGGTAGTPVALDVSL